MEWKRDHARFNFLMEALEIIDAQDRMKSLRDRLLEGDAVAAAPLRDHFRLTYWEHRGRKILPRDDAASGSVGAWHRVKPATALGQTCPTEKVLELSGDGLVGGSLC